MQSSIVWTDEIPQRSNESSCINDLAFRPDGLKFIAAVGTRVLVYDAIDGSLLHSLKGHKGIVYTVDYAHDGKRFASGGADNVVIIWTDTAEGILKYTHTDSIQKLAYNPQSQCLASCTNSDFGLWAPEQKSVAKHKVVAKVLSAVWTHDGQYLALGLLNGIISVRDKDGAEKRLIERTGPIWTLAWSCNPNGDADILAVGSWDQTLSFYSLHGTLEGKPRKLDFLPTSIQFFSKNKYLLIAGSNRKVGLYTKDSLFLADIAQATDWIWSVQARPKSNCIITGTESGSILMHSIQFGTVHGIYQERYAFRENMIDVIIHHLMTQQKVRIRTRDLVRKISLYKDRLAVQVSDRIIIYELAERAVENEPIEHDMQYRVKARVPGDHPCSLLVVTSEHFILCRKQKLQQFDFQGKREREWILEAYIRYIRVTGGASGKEGLLVGLKNGSVLQIFLGNPFPIPLIQQQHAILCVDMSAARDKLAVVDAQKTCSVYDLHSKELLYQEDNATSVAFNSESDDMLCYASDSYLHIKAGRLHLHSQRMRGFVVGFTSSKVFYLNAISIHTMDIPPSALLYRFMDSNDMQTAYNVACLGITQADWRLLAWHALQKMDFVIAQKAFTRLCDVRSLEAVAMLKELQAEYHSEPHARTILHAEIQAYQGRFQHAAKLFADANEPQKAIQLFSEMRMWDQAKRFAGESKLLDVKDLAEKQAIWAQELQDWRAAAELYVASGNLTRAVDIMSERGWFDEMMRVLSDCDIVRDRDVFAKCAERLLQSKRFALAKDLFMRIDDVDALLRTHLRLEEWEEAIRVLEKHKDRIHNAQDVLVPYAEWLIVQDRFQDALDAYTKAHRQDKCVHLLQQLVVNAVEEKRFRDASYFHWRLADQKLMAIQKEATSEEEHALITSAMEHETLSEIYFAYEMIFAFTNEPFTEYMPESLFHAAIFLLNKATKSMQQFPSVSLGNILYTLGHYAIQLEAFKLARHIFDRLLSLQLRPEWILYVEIASMTLETKPFADKEELFPVDYRSSTTIPLLNTNGNGDVSSHSGHPFIRSFVSFETLPLVEFKPQVRSPLNISRSHSHSFFQPGISDHDAEIYIHEFPETREEPSRDINSISFEEKEAIPIDLFEKALQRQAIASHGKRASYRILQLDQETLRSLHPTDIFIIKYPTKALPYRYFRNMIPEIHLILCSHCRRFFHEEDFELVLLQRGECPCCRHTNPSKNDALNLK
uniref:Intraflagellar transport protein 122 homolog n=1 Tax=Albugo laibachii Nc14 TaxID=890382 RepID=F0WGL9_9STRA|nr:PREDICTED: similar to WD repeat domain 10 isoform 2 putative [Albugo laibachii Nc14]|eukprot:CCA20383.1 PREDICTED: similar to WD repeat domain 10 isoform 2 putative [Albugo laibachii Nc14]